MRGVRCDVHQRAKPKPKRTSYKRDPAIERMYNSKRWRKRRAAHIAVHPWCVDCLSRGINTLGTDADHIEPHNGNVEKFFNGELQTLCKPCHGRKTRRGE